MHPHPRIRKTVKWGGLALTVLLVGVWIGSGWVRWQGAAFARMRVEGGAGMLTVLHNQPMPNVAFTPFAEIRGPLGLVARPFAFYWWFWSTGAVGPFWEVGIPLWAPAILALTGTALAWRLDTLARHRARLDLCPTCHYDRTGLASKDAVCPECGAAAPSRP